ncbi:hypothetical protein [Muricoccus radiodurans]|uniref:hypothetical protein n=1 Tax=Muricoccus radiodurans TaxID=2231721 RepID=UPI003CEFBE20
MAVLAAAMEHAPPPKCKARLPAGYTYALQLVAHDVVDTSLPFWAAGQSAEARNVQQRPLRLNTIYGGGPGLFPLAYARDPDSAGETIAFRLGPAVEKSGSDRPLSKGRDIPRIFLDTTADGSSAGGLNAVLLADARNDQHLLLSQTVVIFMALHNAILALLPPVPATHEDAHTRMRLAEARFACAKAATVLIYRTVLQEDMLRNILHPEVWSFYAAGRPLLEGAERRRGVPLEFSHGAFRFGHAMIRDNYRLRGEVERHSVGDILNRTSAILPPAFPVTTDWLLDWSNFLPLSSAEPANMARAIGATSQPVLAQGNRFGAIHPEVGKPGVAIRDLMSAGLAGLWSVWALMDAIGRHPEGRRFVPLLEHSRKTWLAELSAWHATVPAAVQPGPKTIDQIKEDPPFPFFVLVEAAAAREHAGLGPLGSIIVAETLLGILEHDPLPADLAARDLRTRLFRTGEMHGFGDALCYLPAIDSLASILRFLADSEGWKDATPPLFTVDTPATPTP